MLSALIGSFIVSLILFGISECTGQPLVANEADVRYTAIVMMVICGVLWLIRGPGIAVLFSVIGSWLGYMAAVMTIFAVHQRRKIER